MVDEIIKALRCSASPITERPNCEGCRYRVLDEVDPRFNCAPDVEIDGIMYWEGCDCDKICMDAADALERMHGRTD